MSTATSCGTLSKVYSKGSVLNYEMLRYCTKYVISFQTIIQLDLVNNTTECCTVYILSQLPHPVVQFIQNVVF